MKSTINLRESLSENAYEYVSRCFADFNYNESGLTCIGTFIEMEYIKFFPSGRADFGRLGEIKDCKHFNSYQECVDYVMNKK